MLRPFFKAYWQTALPLFIALAILEYIKPGVVHSIVHMSTFATTIFIVFVVETITAD